MSNERTYEQAKIAFKKLSLDPGDVVTVTLPDDILHEQMVAFSEVLGPLASEHSCSVIFLRAGITLNQVTVQEMNDLGWYWFDPEQKKH